MLRVVVGNYSIILFMLPFRLTTVPPSMQHQVPTKRGGGLGKVNNTNNRSKIRRVLPHAVATAGAAMGVAVRLVGV